jgi:two-component system chemotaxis response regulator CheY
MAPNVLIVDDSAAIRKILQRVLRQAEIPLGELYEAGDGLQALEVLKSAAVDLVLSDINMPNMDGLQLLAQIKSSGQWPNLKVLMITTEGNQARVMEAVGLGASGYVKKPFTADQIKERLLTMF